MTVWVGADWDKDKCVVEAECDGEIIKARVKRNPEAVRQFVSRFDGRPIVVGIEAGDPLWARLWEQTGAEVFVFDAKKAKNYARSLSSSNASDDKRSAETLRSQVQSAPHRAKANQSLPAELRGISRLLAVQDTVRVDIGRQTNRLGAVLRQVHPALSEVLDDLDGVTVVRLLRAGPTPKAWLELSPEDQCKALKGFHRKRREQVLRVLGEDWTDLRGGEEAAARLHVRQIIDVLEPLLRQRSQVEKALEAEALEDSTGKTAFEIDGLGPVLSAGAALADDGRERGRDRLARRLGTAPVTVKSGTRGDAHPSVRMRRCAGARLRRIGYLIAVQLVRRHAWAKAQFAYYKAKGIDAPGAYRRIGRSFGRILAALVRDEVPFDEGLYVAKLKAKGVAWAAAL